MGLIDAQLRQCLGRCPVAMRPVETFARQETHLALIEAGMQAIAVILEFMHPAITRWRLGTQKR
jgi:hypothetical protein